MPGITGFVGMGSSAEEEAVLDRMARCMMHQPDYISASYIDRVSGLHIAWIGRKASFSDCIPIWNETKDFCLVFFGEDFTDPEEIERIKAKGHNLAVDNASYIVHLYEEFGIQFIERLNGWFSGILVDLRRKNVVLFNDRYGLGRIYYHETPKGFYFSSEAKSLLQVLPELRQIDHNSLAETFSCGCILQNRTLFSGISLLPPGSRWLFDGEGRIKKESYFRPGSWENQSVLTDTAFYEELKETFSRIVLRYFRGTRQIGMSLTGGLDGRMILAWANRPAGSLPCYTFGGSYRDCADVLLARRISAACGQQHETLTVDSRFFAEFPDLAERVVFLSDGTMDVTGSVELYVNAMARKIAPVRLTGNYGSEILRGNIAFKPSAFNEEILDPGFARLVRNAASTYGSERRTHRQSFIAFKQVPWHHYSRFSVEESQVSIRSPYLDNDLVSLTYRANQETILSKKPSLRLIADGSPSFALIPTDRGVLYRPTPVIGKMRKSFAEFTAKSEYAYDYGMPQWVAQIDHILAPLRPERLFLGRHKFYHFRVWYRDQLSTYLKNILLDQRARQRPYLCSKSLEKIVNDHVEGRRNHTLEISRVLTSELLHRRLIEQRN
jgi:asparagine synthase (glutamine-hydrolysing)